MPQFFQATGNGNGVESLEPLEPLEPLGVNIKIGKKYSKGPGRRGSCARSRYSIERAHNVFFLPLRPWLMPQLHIFIAAPSPADNAKF